MALQWFEDPSEYVVDLRPGPAKRPGRINDAYAQWTLGHGAQFNLTEEFRGARSEPSDFDYAIAFRDLSAAKGRVCATAGAANGTAPTDGVRDDLYIGRLPLRTSSIAPSVLSGSGQGEDIAEPVEPALDGVDTTKLVIVGVIDDAIQIAHPRFQDAHGRSRVDAAWIQDATYVAGTGPEPGPKSALWRQFGRVLRRGEITHAISTYGNDQMGLMQTLGLVANAADAYRPSPLRFASSHGTHVADLAAGYAPKENAIHRRIMAVQLPVYVTQDVSGASLPASVIAASGFIFAQAAALSRAAGVPVPVVLNFSYGTAGGLRDGTDIIERAMRAQAEAYRNALASELGVAPPTVTVLPAGNGNVSRGHARSESATGSKATLDTKFRLQPDDRSPSFAEYWVSKDTSHVAVTVTTPTGVSQVFQIDLPGAPADPGAVTLANDYVLAGAGAALDPTTIVGRLSVDCPACYPDEGGLPSARTWRILLSLGPTAALIQGQPTIPAGLWRVSCVASGDPAGRIMAWLQRDTESLGFGLRGRQSYFEDKAYDATLWDKMGDIAVADQTDSFVTRNGTVSGIASHPEAAPTGVQMVNVGSQRWDIAGPWIHSAAGYAPHNTPLILAPSETSRLLSGVLAAGNNAESKVAQGGTSNAAPQVARLLADAAEATAPADYGTFSARDVIENLAEPPDRPNGEQELASNRVVRVQRSELGTLKPLAALAASVARKSRRKRH